MKKQIITDRKLRTRTLIQLGGLMQKSGLLDILNIEPGDDLQEFESLYKASQVLGFMYESLEKYDIEDSVISAWEKTGERLLRYGTS